MSGDDRLRNSQGPRDGKDLARDLSTLSTSTIFYARVLMRRSHRADTRKRPHAGRQQKRNWLRAPIRCANPDTKRTRLRAW